MVRKKKSKRPNLRLLTLNMGLLKIKLGNIVLREQIAYPQARAAKLPEAIRKMGPDIVLLQEVFHDDNLEQIIGDLAGDYPFIINSRPSRPHLRFHPGLITLSKYPIVKSRTVTFLDAPIDERLFACKGWLSCRIDGTPVGDLVLYNTHLTAGGLIRKPHCLRLQQIRMNQLRQLSIAAHRWNHPLTLIGGDLNCGPDISASNFRYMESHGWDDTWGLRMKPKRPKLEVTWWIGNPLNFRELHKTTTPQRIDHFLLSHRARRRISVAEAKVVLHKPQVPTGDGGIVTLSDHYGYRVTLAPEKVIS